jgi:hypothetical protein
MTGGFTDRQATGAHDRLHARCLALCDGRMCIAIVVCDSCLIPAEIFDAAKRLAAEKSRPRIPVQHLLMSATHTHTAPTAMSLAQCEPDSAYLEFLTERIALSVREAIAKLEPARIGWGVASVPGQVFNRRWKLKPDAIPPDPFGETTDQVRTNPGILNPALLEPAGPTDPEISFVSLQSASGRPIAVLASYSLHYVGNLPPNLLSADYFGEFARQLGQRFKNDSFVGILANGTSGDVNNIDVRNAAPAAKPFEKIREAARVVSDSVFDAMQKVEYRDWAPLAMVQREISVGVRRPTAEQVARAREVLAKAAGPVLTVPEVYARERILLAEFPEQVPITLQAVRIGELGIVAQPCEAFAEIGLEIKRRTPLKPTFVIGLANDYRGYLPTPAQHALGGYETWPCRWSYLEPNASNKMIESLVEMLAATAAEARGG